VRAGMCLRVWAGIMDEGFGKGVDVFKGVGICA
jgi:hypothetical protein